jgi:ABC-type oligopeptide transport system substrate-binding subunit/DNA-binding SARP family transcriptional activator
MPRLSLYLLGPPHLELDGEVLDIGRRKAVALIAYLAVTRQGQARDALATLFWPEYDQSRARAALRRTLSTLNRALGGAWIEADRETIDLAWDDDLWVDVKAFHRQLAEVQSHGHPEAETCPDCLSHLAEAASLYRDDFMAGFTLRDSPGFDDWQFFQAESLRRELAGALERLVCSHCAMGEYEPAVDYARRWLRLDPLHEEAHCWLMQLYAWTDQRPAALRQYQECVRILEEELGIAPSEETTTLYELIQSGELSRGAVLFPAPRPLRPSAPLHLRPSAPLPAFLDGPPPYPHMPFVAREEELAQLGDCLDAAMARGGYAVFVTGEAGGGKTALVHEFSRRAQEAVPDLVVAIGNCNAHTGLGDPYLPFREILGLLTGDIKAKYVQGAITQENARRLWALHPASLQALAEVGPNLIDSFIPAATLTARASALLPDGASWADHLQALIERQRENANAASVAQSDLFEQYTHLLQTLSREHPLLLVVEDAQWADAASINLLFHLSRRLAGGRILLVVTYRPDDVALGRPLTSSGQRERHPLEPVINELKRAYGDIWIDLESAMGRPFIDALLDVQPNRLGEGFRAALSHQTEGHPLFTIELLRAMQERGDLVRDPEGRWVAGPTLDWKTLPARVEAVVEERVGRLEAGLRDILAVASVEGETFTAQVVARVQGLGERPLLGALSQELERRHHLVRAQGEIRVDHKFLSRFRFTHTVFQQYLYNTFSPGERRLLHGEIAAALEDLYQEEGDKVTVQLARHYAEAGQVEQAMEYLLRAGDRARDVYAYHEAIDFYERALAFLQAQGAYERAARTLMKLGLTYHLDFNFLRAREAYQEGFALWQRAGAAPIAPSPPAPHPLRMPGDDPPTLDPTRATDDVSGQLINQLFSGLVTLNPELDVVPELAQSWEMLEGGEQWVFHLREDAHWNDGRPVTAGDFIYAWRRVLNPALGSGIASYLYDIKGARAYHQGQLLDPDQIGVRAPDPTTLLVELEGPTGYFPFLLTQPMLFPVPRHAVEAHGEAWTEIEHLVTNGPFRLERWEPGSSMILTRNPDYPGEFTGNVEQITLILSKNEAAEHMMALYESDRLDLTYLQPSPETDRMRQRYAGEYFSGPALYTQYLGFNVDQPPFDDPRVRRALAMATDKEKLANVTLAGYDFPAAGGLIPPEMPGHSPEIGLSFDPERAQALLAQAGYPGGRGFPEVQGLVGHGHKKRACDDLSAQWRENLGIDVVWQDLEFGHLLERLDRERPPLLLMGWRADYPDPDNALRMNTHRQWTGWRDPTYERLLEEAKYIADHEERMKLYQQADRTLVEDASVVPLIYGRHQYLIKPWVHKLPLSAMTLYLWKDVIIEPH